MAASSALAVDLVPQTAVREMEGAHFTQLQFQDGLFRITYDPPNGSTYYKNGSAVNFTMPKKPQAEASIQIADGPMALASLDEKTINGLKQEMLGLLPRGSENVTLLSEQKNALIINGHETYESSFAYTFYGQRFNESILIAALGSERMTVRISAREQDFKDIYTAFHGSLYSLQWLKN